MLDLWHKRNNLQMISGQTQVHLVITDCMIWEFWMAFWQAQDHTDIQLIHHWQLFKLLAKLILKHLLRYVQHCSDVRGWLISIFMHNLCLIQVVNDNKYHIATVFCMWDQYWCYISEPGCHSYLWNAIIWLTGYWLESNKISLKCMCIYIYIYILCVCACVCVGTPCPRWINGVKDKHIQ